MPRDSQQSTPYVDALLAYSARDPGRFQVPGHKGGVGADPGAARAGRRDRPAQRHPLDHRRGRHRPPADAVRAGAAVGGRGLEGTKNLVPDQRRFAGEPHDLPGARARGRARGRAAQRPLLGDRRPGPQRDEAELRRAGARSRARHRPLFDAGLAGRDARGDTRRGRGDGRLAHLLRRLRRHRRPGGGRPPPRRAAGGRRGLGRPSALPPRPAPRRARGGRRPGRLLDPQDRRQPDAGGDAPSGGRRPGRRGDRRPLREPGGNDQPERAPLRLARRRAPPGPGPRRGAARARPWPGSPRPGGRSIRSRGCRCSTTAWSAAPGSPAGTRSASPSTCVARGRPATGWRRRPSSWTTGSTSSSPPRTSSSRSSASASRRRQREDGSWRRCARRSGTSDTGRASAHRGS